MTVTYSFTSAGENDAATLKAVSNKPTATAQDLLTGKSAVHSQTFNLTGAVQHFTVPSGVTQITVDAVGASGGQSFGFPGGLGYEVKATLAVNPLDVLDVYVGGSGAEAGPGGCTGGFNGGANPTCPFGSTGAGGGGASDVRPNGGALADRIIVAGGGGGGQNATSSGGNAGYLSGADGQHDPTITYTIVDATGGTQTAGGAAGTSSPGFNGHPGSFGNGGAGDTNGAGQDPGSGGGGGWYGGGGGAASGSGAGGSSHLAAAATHVSDNQATWGECDAGNNGCITISW